MSIPKRFTDLAPQYMRLLMKDFGFSAEDAAAVLGNAGHESLGFTVMQEIHPRSGRGGLGWFQWTGPRRVAFEAFLKGRSPSDPYLNYGMLFRELTGAERGAVAKTKAAVGLYGKVIAFEEAYERAGVKNYPSRYAYAQAALSAFRASEASPPAPPLPGPTPTPPRGFWARFFHLLTRGTFK